MSFRVRFGHSGEEIGPLDGPVSALVSWTFLLCEMQLPFYILSWHLKADFSLLAFHFQVRRAQRRVRYPGFRPPSLGRSVASPAGTPPGANAWRNRAYRCLFRREVIPIGDPNWLPE